MAERAAPLQIAPGASGGRRRLARCALEAASHPASMPLVRARFERVPAGRAGVVAR